MQWLVGVSTLWSLFFLLLKNLCHMLCKIDIGGTLVIFIALHWSRWMWHTNLVNVLAEAQVLRDRGFSESLITMMLEAWKSTSCKVCHQMWKTSCTSLDASLQASHQELLFGTNYFLPAAGFGPIFGFKHNQGPGVCSFFIVFHKRLAIHSLIKVFVWGVSHVTTPVFPQRHCEIWIWCTLSFWNSLNSLNTFLYLLSPIKSLWTVAAFSSK